MFSPQIIKQFDENGACTTKIGGILGTTLENTIAISLSASGAIQDYIIFWFHRNLDTFPVSKFIPEDKFQKTIIMVMKNPGSQQFIQKKQF